jgi:lipopolysaccharide biosynthesis glycosyltransferase
MSKHEKTKYMHVKNLIVSPAFSWPATEYHKITLPLIEQYAQKVGAALLVPTTPRGYPTLGFEKWTYKELLKSYDRILHIDADILLRPHCPNLFDVVPYGYFAGVDEQAFAGPSWERPYIDRLADMQTFGPLEAPEVYLNMGLFLMDRTHLDVLADPADDRARYKEQSLINYRLHKGRHNIYLLPPEFNHMLLMDLAGYDRSKAFAVHYAGRWGGLPVNQVIQLMLHDTIK